MVVGLTLAVQSVRAPAPPPAAVAPTTPSPSPSAEEPAAAASAYGPQDALRDLRRVLRERAAALLAGDRESFVATLDDEDPPFVAQQTQAFENLQLLGVDTVRYDVGGRLLPVGPVQGDRPRIKPDVVEHVQLAGVDVAPVAHEVGFTFVRRRGAWLLAAEELDETRGTLRGVGVSRPWAYGPVAVDRAGPLTLVVDLERAAVLPGLAARATGALAYVREQLGVEGDAPLLVDATDSGAATRFTRRGDALAGATFGPAMTTDLTGHTPSGIAGWRLKYNPERLDRFLADDRVMRHELTHFVLREVDHPLWLMEGVAEYLGWRRTPLTRLYVPTATFARLTAEVPDDRLLRAREIRAAPEVAYTGAQAVVEELVARQGLGDVVALAQVYDELAEDGVPDAEADARALERVFATTESDVAAAAHRRLMRIQRP